MLKTHIQKVGAANGIKPKNKKSYTLSEIVQESYKLSYKAKSMKDGNLIKLTESHLENIKKNPTNIQTLSEDTDVLKDLVKVGKDHKIKDLEEVGTTKKRRKRSVDSCMKPMMKESWQKRRKTIGRSLESFRENAKNKVFFKELGKFNSKLSEGKQITLKEAIDLYKASNSCLTHLTVELDKNPRFLSAYRECTSLLSRDNTMLLESIQENKVPNKDLLESFAVFTNILLECDAPEDLEEDDNMEELDDRDVINEDADMEELDDKDVINEDADMEELDDCDVINEDDNMEELDDRDVINESEFNEDPSDEAVVDLTDEEIEILRSILSKITGPNENVETVEDEEEIEDLEEFEDEVEDEEFEDFEDEEVFEEDFEDEDFEDDEECFEEEEFDDEEEFFTVPDEELDEEEEETPDEDFETRLAKLEDTVAMMSGEDEEELDESDDFEDEEDLEEDADMEELDDKDVINEEEEIEDEEFEDELEENDDIEVDDEEEEIEDYDTPLSESARLRIKKCF